MQEGSTRAVIAALIANAGIGVAKFIAWIFTGSSSLLAESIHSLADTSNQALLLLGGRTARREETPEHPFGHGRERYFWSFIVALVLFSLGGLFALYEGSQKLRSPHAIESPGWAFAVLILGILLEGYSFRTAVVESRHRKGSAGWWSFIRNARSPELPVVLLEDAGALLGLVFALIGVTLTVTTGDPVWDAYGTLAIGVLLVVIAAVLVVEMKSLLIGESAQPAMIAKVRDAIETSDDVVRLIHMRTLHLGPDELLIAAKVEFDPSLGTRQVVAAINVVEENIRAAIPIGKRIYIEPDIHDPTMAESDNGPRTED